jgi:hypothetical protein
VLLQQTAPGAATAYVSSTLRKNQKRSKLQLPLEADENVSADAAGKPLALNDSLADWLCIQFYDDTDGFIDDANVVCCWL